MELALLSSTRLQCRACALFTCVTAMCRAAQAIDLASSSYKVIIHNYILQRLSFPQISRQIMMSQVQSKDRLGLSTSPGAVQSYMTDCAS